MCAKEMMYNEVVTGSKQMSVLSQTCLTPPLFLTFVYFLSLLHYIISCAHMDIYIYTCNHFLTFVLADEGSRAETS